jgi:hypothetical protein
VTKDTLRKALKAGGVTTGRQSDGRVAHIVEFVDHWGVMRGATTENSSDAICAALDEAGIRYTLGNMVMVRRDAIPSESGSPG